MNHKVKNTIQKLIKITKENNQWVCFTDEFILSTDPFIFKLAKEYRNLGNGYVEFLFLYLKVDGLYFALNNINENQVELFRLLNLIQHNNSNKLDAILDKFLENE